MARRAFTLVELLVAVSLSAVIIVLAASAFRLVTSSVRTAMRLSTENNLLRAGALAVIDDADFWHSYANPDPPYNKGFTADPILSTDGTRKRHMAVVRFHASPDPAKPIYPSPLNAESLANHPLPNPMLFMAHDPRGWNRTHLLPSTRPHEPNKDVSEINDWSGPTGAPAGWSGRHVHGPYHLCSSSDMSKWDDMATNFNLAKGDYGLTGLQTRINQAQPHYMLKVFQRLGMYGLAGYLPNGVSTLFMDSMGDLPWWGSDPVGGLSNHPYQSANTCAYNYQPNFRPWPVADFQRWLGLQYDQGTKCFFLKPIERFEAKNTGLFGNNEDIPSYQEYYTGLESPDGANTDNGRSPLMHVIPDTGSYVSNGGDRYYNRPLNSITVRLPYNVTDWTRLAATNYLDLTSKPANLPILTTQHLRYESIGGSDLPVLRALIEDPNTGRRIEMRFSLLSTTYRGARQHWSAVTSGAMGDIYVP